VSASISFELPPDLVDLIAERVSERLAERHDTDKSPWLTVERASEYTGIPKSTLYKNRAIPRHKPDGRLLFHRDELDAYVRGEVVVARGKNE
jgi:excisionase family DNA binding protein